MNSAWHSFIDPFFETDARFGSTSFYFRVFADGKSESRLDGIDWDNFQKTKLLPISNKFTLFFNYFLSQRTSTCQ